MTETPLHAAPRSCDGAAMQARVDGLGAEARRWDVTSIPTWFILPEGWRPGLPPPVDGADFSPVEGRSLRES